MSKTVQTAIGKLAVVLGLALLAACGPRKWHPRRLRRLPRSLSSSRRSRNRSRCGRCPRAAPSIDMLVPAVGPDGVRNTVNARLNPLEAVWNFRSGWNVAALNCLDARYQPILDGYKTLLTEPFRSALTKVNTELDKQYRAEVRAQGPRRSARARPIMTQVYNYFAPAAGARLFLRRGAADQPGGAAHAPDATSMPSPLALAAQARGGVRASSSRTWSGTGSMSRHGMRDTACPSAYGAGQSGGAVYTNATYGRQARRERCHRRHSRWRRISTSSPPGRRAAGPRERTVLPQQPVFSSQPVVQAAPSGGN